MTQAATSPNSIVEILRQRAIENPETVGYRFVSEVSSKIQTLTYAELDARARTIGGWLQARGLSGSPVALIFPAGIDYVCALFGTLYAGAVALPLNPPGSTNHATRLGAVLSEIKCPVALTTVRLLPRISRVAEQIPELTRIEFFDIERLPESAALDWRDPGASRAAPAVLQYTSGSTAAPKGVNIRNGNLLHNLALMTRVSGLDSSSIGVSWLPQYHDMGLVAGIFMPAYAGFPVTLLTPASFLSRPLRWLEAISSLRATVSGAPNFAYEHCVRNIRQEELAGIDLSSWRVAYSGAEPIRPHTISRFVSAFAHCGFREQTFFPCYGLAEATLMVSGGPLSAPPMSRWFTKTGLSEARVVAGLPDSSESIKVAPSGVLIEDHEIAIVDPANKTPCDPDRIGEIWVAGESVGAGYWNRPYETEETFGARLASNGAGPFLRTGDLGFIYEGMLFVTGRRKDLIIIRGMNHHPQDIEQTVEESHPAFRPGCGAVFSVDGSDEERLIVVYEIEGGYAVSDDSIFHAVAHGIAERHGLQASTIILIKRGTIFKTTSGKVQRHNIRAAFLANRLAVIREWRLPEPDDIAPAALAGTDVEGLPPVEDAAGIQELLIRELAHVLHTDRAVIDPQQSIYELGIDSLMAAHLCNRLATHLGIELQMADILVHSTIAGLTGLILERLSNNRPSKISEEIMQVVRYVAELPAEEIARILDAERQAAREPPPK